ncbi:hypothetical protein [Rhodococcus jostii]|uniref:hypothetical protein n=1 Tax=Rhodococcus jostii TaxID=132919 RepID=UPI003642E58C
MTRGLFRGTDEHLVVVRRQPDLRDYIDQAGGDHDGADFDQPIAAGYEPSGLQNPDADRRQICATSQE